MKINFPYCLMPALLTGIGVLGLAAPGCVRHGQPADYPVRPVPFTQVKVAPESFWGQRLEASRSVTIPQAFAQCEKNGRYRNFVQARLQMDSAADLIFPPSGFSFDDTDVYKTIEGASYVLQVRPDSLLDAYIDSILVLVAAAQEPDGYLYTPRTMNPRHPHEWAGASRWSKEEVLSHELYNLGHLVEGAVAHYQATGKRTFLDIACRYADCVVREVGPNAGQSCVVPGHQIAEMALCRLYLATGERKYLDEARFFLDMRGRTEIREAYSQSHLPVLDQEEAVGHAVRAAYMYAGMADVAALTGDPSFVQAIDRIWDNIVTRKLYLTGGIGATKEGEAFGPDWYLPNATSYCETCAAIGNVYVNHRMFLLHGESKYYDVLERTLYNGLISGCSLDGGAFFYPNPLESDGSHQRQPWFGCACCPSNLCRFIPSLPGYVYAVRNDELFVNLYMPCTATVQLDDKTLTLTQQNRYPWDGDILLTVDAVRSAGAERKGGDSQESAVMALKLRIPGWVRGEVTPGGLYTYADRLQTPWSVELNGAHPEAADLISGPDEDGYCTLRRHWKAGDSIRLHLPMPARLVRADERVEADRGRLAVLRGPLVYCAEWKDNPGFSVRKVTLNAHSPMTLVHQEGLPGYDGTVLPDGMDLIEMRAYAGRKPVNISLIPYYAWNHRGSGEMIVWMHEAH